MSPHPSKASIACQAVVNVALALLAALTLCEVLLVEC